MEGDERGTEASRRTVLKAAAAGGVLAATGLVGPATRRVAGAEDRADPAARRSPTDTVPFFGPHQAGIATPQQETLCFAAFDLGRPDVSRLQQLLRRWSAAAARMVRGLPAEPGRDPRDRAPHDSGEALGLPPARLTVTFGLGPRVFDLPLLGDRRPAALVDLPPFAGDALERGHSGGDLAVQACADDPSVAFHAVRMLANLAGDDLVLRWVQRGFLPVAAPGTPRNLMGHKDGTANPSPTDPEYDGIVWVQPSDGPDWLGGGSYLVVRRIRMHLAQWDTSDLSEQEETIGRRKASGAPLTGGGEHSELDFSARRRDGSFVIPIDAHVRRASPGTNGGARILRRGYSYDDGVATISVPADGDRPASSAPRFDAGLLFLAYQRDPAQFVRIQRSLAESDHLDEYVTHVGSALFVVPPGARPGGYVGETLFR